VVAHQTRRTGALPHRRRGPRLAGAGAALSWSPMVPLAVSGRLVIVVAVVAALAFAAFLLRSEG
jgi:hypothetical protein